MVYDNTKFYAAFKAWIEQNVEVGFGEHYAGDLLDDFCEFCDETKMMKRSPGRVVFGQRLSEHGGFERRKHLGLTYWSGLKLKKARILKPKRHAKTVDEEVEDEQERLMEHTRDDVKDTPEKRRAALDKFHQELIEEEERMKSLEDAVNENL